MGNPEPIHFYVTWGHWALPLMFGVQTYDYNAGTLEFSFGIGPFKLSVIPSMLGRES